MKMNFNKKIGMIVGISIVMIILSFYIATISLDKILENNKKHKTYPVNSINMSKMVQTPKIKKDEKVHIKNESIKSIYNKNDKNDITEKYIKVVDLKISDEKGKFINIVGKDKMNLKGKKIIYDNKTYSIDIDDSNVLTFTNIKYDSNYIVKFDGDVVAIYKSDESGVLTKVKDTKYKISDLTLKDLDKSFFENNKIQIESLDKLEDALSEFKS